MFLPDPAGKALVIRGALHNVQSVSSVAFRRMVTQPGDLAQWIRNSVRQNR